MSGGSRELTPGRGGSIGIDGDLEEVVEDGARCRVLVREGEERRGDERVSGHDLPIDDLGNLRSGYADRSATRGGTAEVWVAFGEAPFELIDP